MDQGAVGAIDSAVDGAEAGAAGSPGVAVEEGAGGVEGEVAPGVAAWGGVGVSRAVWQRHMDPEIFNHGWTRINTDEGKGDEMMNELTVRRPLLRYFGGKWQLRHWIIGHFPEHRFYAEPFAGAASVLLAKKTASGGEIINDLNGHTVNLFRVLQNKEQAEELKRRLMWTPYAKAEFELAKNWTGEPVEDARRLLVRSFMGISLAGMKGQTGFRMGNVDLSRLDQVGKRTFRNCAVDWSHWKNGLELLRKRLEKVMIYERDALEFIDLMDSPECLLYIDPPYDHAARSTNRYVVDFDRHEELAGKLLSKKAMVVLSGYECAAYDCLVNNGWQKVEKDYRANMSLQRRTECLWISPNAQKGGAHV